MTAEPITIDASVFVNAFSPSELGSDKSLAFIRQAEDEAVPVIVPALLLPEIAAAISRKQGDAKLAMMLVEQISELQNITLIDLDESLARLAAQTASTHKLRGSDAVYAAVALRFGTTLVTLDREQLQRFEKAVSPQ
jgi:predicted nucleic acid-binding protein